MKKHIYLNLKRFDVAPEGGGVNRLAAASAWAKTILDATREGLSAYDSSELECSIFWPESHVAAAGSERGLGHPALAGCQSVAPFDVAPGVNFGAMTSQRSAKAMAALGCESVLIGHCEERKALREVMLAGLTAFDPEHSAAPGVDARLAAAVTAILAKKIRCAQEAGLSVLFCIGESAEQRPYFAEVLAEQLTALEGADAGRLALAYEPIWAIGPGKTPPGRDEIQAVAATIKALRPDLPLAYGGGLKQDNAAMLASIPEIDGGLIALTRFSGEIGFYPDEYLDIIRLYMEAARQA